MTILIALALMPFIQIGFSYYVAIHTVSLGLCFASKERLSLLLQKRVLLCIGIAYVMVASASLYPGSGTADTLRAGRQALCFLLIVAILGTNIHLSGWAERHVLGVLTAVVIGQFLLVIAQSGAISRGIYLGLSRDLYVANADTIPTALDLLYSKIRPAGTFGEPSYLAAVCTTLALAISPLWQSSRKVVVVFILLVVTCFMSMSMLGILSITITLCITLLRADKRWIFVMSLIAALAPIILGIYLVNSSIVERLGAIATGNDVSANARIFTPLSVIAAIMADSPFGIPSRAFQALTYLPGISISPSSLSHNSFFNLMINYGLVGLVMVVIMFAVPKGLLLRAGLFVLMMQNGSLLGFDKVTLVTLFVILHNTAQHHRTALMRREASPAPGSTVATSARIA